MRAKIKWWKSLVARLSAADRELRMERAGPQPTRSHDVPTVAADRRSRKLRDAKKLSTLIPEIITFG